MADAYEDMFKEITRKLYGEEAGHGLHGNPAAYVGQTSLPEGGERKSFTNINPDRTINVTEFAVDGSKDHLFGLAAALMQNGLSQTPTDDTFMSSSMPPNNAHGDFGNWASANGAEKQRSSSSTNDTHHKSSNDKVKRSSGGDGSLGQKRYKCSSCPYSTDRRDLYTRHENIHKEEKPFFCYICMKQFNRADHVKKHFMRMHREMPYNINKTRRTSSYRPEPSTTEPEPSAVFEVTLPPQTEREVTITPLQPPTFIMEKLFQDPTILPNLPQLQEYHRDNHHHHNHQPAAVQVQVPENRVPVDLVDNCQTSPPKKSGDKRFSCTFCAWTGTDNWGLKRHLNTHTKPFVCSLCEYRAARSERLVTHVFRVHNKKACNKCNFLADDHLEYMNHLANAHASSDLQDAILNPTNSVLSIIKTSKNTGFGDGNGGNAIRNLHSSSKKRNVLSAPVMPSQIIVESPKKSGADRLFNYMEAEPSHPGDYQRQQIMTALSRSARNIVAQDFHKAGGGVQHRNSTERAWDSKFFFNGQHQEKFIRDLEEFVVQRLVIPQVLDVDNAKSGAQPPAKRKRAGLPVDNNNDKENQSQTNVPNVHRPAHNGKSKAKAEDLRDIFQMIAKIYGDRIGETSKFNSNNNNTSNRSFGVDCQEGMDLSAQKHSNGDSGLDDDEESEEKDVGPPKSSKRKCFVPRKIDAKNNLIRWNAIRDKHLSRLMSAKKSCNICVGRQNSIIIPHHTSSSLILHKRWRHRKQTKHCTQCGHGFKMSYQLQLHMRLNH